MYKITEKVALNPTVTKMVIEAPLIAKKAKPGQFIIVRPFEDSERIPLTVAGYDREKGTVDNAALLVEFTGDGQRNGAAHAAADDTDLLQAFHLGSAAQRADEVVDALTYFEAVQLHGGAAHDLENDIHSACLAVITGHGQGDALAVLKRAHNDKLARLCFFGNERGFNDHLCHGGVQRDFLSDLIHCVCSFFWQDLSA